MKRIASILLCLSLGAFLGGCAVFGRSYGEFTQMDLVQTLGIDLAEDGSGDLVLTAVSRTETAADSGSGAAPGARISVGRGGSILEAIGAMSAYTGKELFLGHTSQILVGEELARSGLDRIIDFFIRNYRIRLDLTVTVVRGGSARDFIRAAAEGEQFITDRIARLYHAGSRMSAVTPVRCMDLYASLLEPAAAQRIPYALWLAGEETGVPGENQILLSGYGIFRQGKLLGYMDEEAALGCNWFAGEMRSHSYGVADPAGKRVTLAVSGDRTDIRTELREGIPHVTFRLEAAAELGESEAPHSLYTPEDLDAMAAHLAAQIESQILDAIEISRTAAADILGVGGQLARSQPDAWEAASSGWSELYPQTVFALDIRVRVHNSYQTNRIPSEDTP